MKTNKLLPRLWLCAFLGLASLSSAQTIVSGPNISGTWGPCSGCNPYIIAGDCNVPAGQKLTVQPGVVVWIGAGVSITVYGEIQAVGTPTQRIIVQAPTGSQYWNSLFLYPYDYSKTNRLKYCDFQNASTAVSISDPFAGAMATEIMNCTFSNCISQGIYVAVGGNVQQFLQVRNCDFASMSNGCVINLVGTVNCCGGYANATILANKFRNLAGAALLLTAEIGGASPALFLNNTIVSSQQGVIAQDPWDTRVQDNIFVGCTNAVTAIGSLSRNVSYNDFYGNATNFTGYSGNYGNWIIPNRNGTLSDIFSNIGENPLFLATNDFHLATNSPCVDAGTPDWVYSDMCFPPSQGTGYPDLGAYGGPDACNWLDVVPELPVTASASQANGIGTLSWDAVPRSTYRLQYCTNLVSAGTNIWLDFVDVLATDKPTSFVGALDQPKAFIRIQSLGRTPGN